jgi:hypothetical protein
LREVRELPFHKQITKTKDLIKRMVNQFEDDHFDTEDIKNHKGRSYVGEGRVDRIKVLKYLSDIGEINILKEEDNYIEFKVTEKFGSLPTVKVEVPITEHIINSFNDDLPRMMAAYGILSGFENKLRFFISSQLEQYHGSDWWNTQVPKKIKDNIKNHRLEKWHISIPKKNIQYTDFHDLKNIINKNWEIFEDVFMDQNHIKVFLEQIEIPRNTIAHSNVLSKSMYDDLKNYTEKILNLIDQYEAKTK